MFTLLSDTKIILLEEPTLGMDPWLRHGIWNTLKELKTGKIIILTTNSMDEAEYLGDRVAIISNGKLKCCGSTQFLKDKYCDTLIFEV